MTSHIAKIEASNGQVYRRLNLKSHTFIEFAVHCRERKGYLNMLIVP